MYYRKNNITHWLLIGSTLALQAIAWGEEAARPQKFEQAVLIRFEGEINPLSEQSFYRRLATAQRRQPDLLIVEIDSPGGWVDCSLNLADRLRRIDWARTVAFVPREAISGGSVMALGCDDIVMAPDAHLGDAGAITLDAEGAFRYVEEKKRSYLASRLRSLAEAKGRSPALAEALCDMDLVVFQVRNTKTGKEAFMSERELSSSAEPEQWEKLRQVFGAGQKRFLTMNGKEAVDLKIAQSLCANREELKKQYGVTGEVIVLEHTALDTAVIILNSTFITGLLIVIGLIALYVEFSMPGTCIGGLIAGLCFTLFFWSRFLGGTSGWLELILFVAGLVFLGIEVFVLPGFGVAGISGILLVIASVVMASQTFIVPKTTQELNTTLTQIAIVSTSTVVFIAAAAMFSRYLGAIPLAKGLILDLPPVEGTAVAASTSAAPVTLPGRANLPVTLGDEGVADSPLRPAGKVRFGDAYVDVVSDGMFVDRGQKVRVVDISGNRVVVRQIEAV